LSNYWFGVKDSIIIFFTCYLLILPFVFKGFKKNQLLTPMLIWLLLGSFSFIIFPWFAIPGYQRWLMLLVFPLIIYSSWGISLLKTNRKKIAVIFLLINATIGLAYSAGLTPFLGYMSNSYVPSGLVKSSIDWDQIEEVESAIKWLQNNNQLKILVLAEERFYGWIMLNLVHNFDTMFVLAYSGDLSNSLVLDKIYDFESDKTYLIWYNNSEIDDFETVYQQKNLSVFEYNLASWK
jgi:hypothetical protein